MDSNNKPNLEIEQVKNLFKEVKIFFPNNLIKSYEDVSRFASQITKERTKYLKDELLEAEEKNSKVTEELKNLNKERSDALSLLGERDTFIKYQK